MDLSLSAVWVGKSPKSTNFGVLPKTELLAKFNLLHGFTSATSAETVSTSLTPLKKDGECSFSAGNPLMFIGLKIYWFPIRVGETEVTTKLGFPQLALDLGSEEEASLAVACSLLVPITFSVTFACRRDVWHGLKLSCATVTLMVTSGVMGRTTAWMARLMNNGYNFCVEIPLVVSVPEIPLVV